jgi:MFS family permease
VASATGAVMVVMTAGLVLGPLVFGLLGSALSYGSAYGVMAFLTLAGALVLPVKSGRRAEGLRTPSA